MRWSRVEVAGAQTPRKIHSKRRHKGGQSPLQGSHQEAQESATLHVRGQACWDRHLIRDSQVAVRSPDTYGEAYVLQVCLRCNTDRP